MDTPLALLREIISHMETQLNLSGRDKNDKPYAEVPMSLGKTDYLYERMLKCAGLRKNNAGDLEERNHLSSYEWIELHKKANEKMSQDGLRRGQSYMNALHEIDLSLYNRIAGSTLDPFYNDESLPKFFEFLT